MRFLRQSLTGLFLLSLTLGALVYAAYAVIGAVQERMADRPEAPERRERVFTVPVLRAEPAEIRPVLTAFGEIESRRTLEIRARTGGTLVELAGDFVEGGAVEAGQLLARIDPADAQSALDRAASDLLDARAETREAERGLALARDELTAAEDQSALRTRAYRRQTDLEGRGVGTAAAVETAELAAAQARQAVLASRQALAQAEARVDQAETRRARAEIARAEAQRRLTETRITAGFAGTLADVAVVEGGLVAQNERLASLVDAERLEVAFRVSTPEYLRLLDAGGGLLRAPVTVTLDAVGQGVTARGTISRDSAVVGEGQTGRLIFARLEDAGGLKPGDFVTVTIEEPPLAEVVRLPAAALAADGTVLALAEGGERLEALTVDLLRRQGDDILVRGTDLEGREIVAARSPLLGAGIKVRPLRAGGDAAAEEEMLELSADRRARLVAFIEASADLSAAAKARLLAQLDRPRVPAGIVRRLETRMGG